MKSGGGWLHKCMYKYWNPESAFTTHEPPPPICIDFWAKSAKGQIQGRAIIGQSMRDQFSTGLYSNKLNIWQWSKSIWEEVLIFLAFTFWHILVSCMWLSHFHLLPFKYIYGAKCLIYIHLFTFHVKENSARLQWYSCARYKAPGPLVHCIMKYRAFTCNGWSAFIKLSCDYFVFQ